ncbi:MAG TPA: hypothetical protein VF865_08860 [Acidobacteriaceae bacterium]
MKFTEGQQLPAPSPPWASQMPEPSRQPSDAQPTAQQEKLRLAARRKRLMEDTDRLLSLATDLKAQVDKSSTTKRFSVDEIKKAGEIEKLAHRVKQQLKG